MNNFEQKLNKFKQSDYHAADHSADTDEVDPFDNIDHIKNDIRDIANRGKQDLGRVASKSLNAAVQTAEQYRQQAINSAQKKLGEVDAISRDGLDKVQIAADNRLRAVHQGGHSRMKKELNSRIADLKSAVHNLDKSSGQSKSRRKKSHK